MKNTLLPLFLVIPNLLFCQKDQLTFIIENRTNTDLYGIFVSGNDDNSWGEDILPDNIFEAGTTLTVTIPISDETICEQDIKLTFSENDANPLIWEAIDFCTLDKMILTQKNKTIYYSLERIQSLTFEIANDTRTDFYGVYVTSSSDKSWGEDLLPKDVFPGGTVVTVTIPIGEDTTCKQDIKVTFSENDDGPLIFNKINFCRLNRLRLTEANGKYFYELD